MKIFGIAPRITVIKIDPEKIGALIGLGGKVIRGITDTCGVQIDIMWGKVLDVDRDGKIRLSRRCHQRLIFVLVN